LEQCGRVGTSALMCGPAIDFGAPAILSIHPHGLQRTGLAGRCQTRFARLPLPPTRTGRGGPSCGAASTCCTARWPQPTRQYPDHSAGNPGYSPSRAHAAFPVQSALAAHPGGAVPPSPSQRPGLAHARRAKRLCKQKPRRGPALRHAIAAEHAPGRLLVVGHGEIQRRIFDRCRLRATGKSQHHLRPPSDEMVRPRVHGPPQTAVLAHGFALTGQLGQASHFEADLCFPTDARKTRGSPHAVGMR
jgi:hypothetical protein